MQVFSFSFFFGILPKFSDFVNSNYFIGKITRNLSDYNQFLFKKIYEINKKQIFSEEKMRNSGNYNL